MLLDVLDGFEEICVCTAYRYKGKEYDYYPAEPWIAERAEPVYKRMKGWSGESKGATSFEDLPDGAKEYLGFLEKELGTGIVLISTGPERDETIIRDDSLRRMLPA